MTKHESPQDVINAYQKRQQRTPFIVGGLAIILVFVGAVVLIYWLSGGGEIKLPFSLSRAEESTPTTEPTSTWTNTPESPTVEPSGTSTITITPTVTITPTHSGPFEYEVEEGDNCYDLAFYFNVDFNTLLALNNFGGDCPIQPGDTILIPATDVQLPTPTLVDAEERRGAEVEYTIQSGDTLDKIALDHLSTVEDIMERNGIDDANTIFVGQVIKIKLGLITAVPSETPTSTPVP